MEGGHAGPSSKKSHAATNDRIKKIVDCYEQYQHGNDDDSDNDDNNNDIDAKVTFLRSVARNIKFNVC